MRQIDGRLLSIVMRFVVAAIITSIPSLHGGSRRELSMAVSVNEQAASQYAVVVEMTGVVEVSGELDIANAGEISAKLIDLAEGGERRLIVNLSGLKFVDAAGINAIYRVLEHVRRIGGAVYLVGARPSVHRIMRITGLPVGYKIYETADDALIAHALEEILPRELEAWSGQAQVNDSQGDTSLFPVTIYLSEADGHVQVQSAVEDLLAEAGLSIDSREDPIFGSWFRRIWAAAGRAVTSPIAREGALVTTHLIDTRLVLAHDAVITAKLMENLAPVIDALKTSQEAVIRVGALLIVKVDGKIAVHQLTAAQQAILDHQPNLAKAPHEILVSLEILARNADSGNIGL